MGTVPSPLRDPLYFLFKVRRTRVIKFKPQGDLLTASESGVEFRARSRVLALIASSPMFFENKRKTTSVYRLYCIGADVMSNSTMQHKPSVMSHEFVVKKTIKIWSISIGFFSSIPSYRKIC